MRACASINQVFQRLFDVNQVEEEKITDKVSDKASDIYRYVVILCAKYTCRLPIIIMLIKVITFFYRFILRKSLQLVTSPPYIYSSVQLDVGAPDCDCLSCKERLVSI